MPQQETQRTIVIQKDERDRDRICTLWGVTEPSMFILETCDGVISTMKNTDGELIGVLTEESPTNIVVKNGYYEVCVIGKGTGTVYVIPYAHNNVDPEDCCDELRAVDIDLQLQINNLRNLIENLQSIINNITQNDCCEEVQNDITNIWQRIRRIEQNIGETCCEELRQEISEINTQITNIWNRINAFDIVAGSGISVTKSGDVYTITNTGQGGGPGTDTNTVTTLVAGNGISISDNGTGGNYNYTITNTGSGDNITIEGGTGISVTKEGDNYTIVNTAPDTGDTNTVTTLLPGTGISITDGGTGGNHVYTITNTGQSGGGTTECCDQINERIDNIGIVAGNGISVTRNGDIFTVTNTAPDTGDTNTVTTLSSGTGISITDNGTGGNHNYTITATGSGSTECCDELNERIDNITITGGTGISVTKNGDNYTVVNTAPDTGDTNTITTLVAGTGISISDNGTDGNHIYTITSTGGSGTVPNEVEVVSVSPNIIVTKRVV